MNRSSLYGVSLAARKRQNYTIPLPKIMMPISVTFLLCSHMPSTELDRAPLKGALWAITGLIGLGSLWLLADIMLQRQAVGREQAKLQRLATDFTTALDRGMAQRAAIAFAAADDPALPTITDPALLQQAVQALHDQDPAFTWIGILSPTGTVQASTNGILIGADSSQRPVYTEGKKGRWIGDVHDALMLAKLLPSPDGEMLRFVDFTAPIRRNDGSLAGVFAVHMGWTWAQKVRDEILHRNAENRGIDLLIISAEGSLLLGRPGEIGGKPSSALGIAGKHGTAIERWQNGVDYVVAAQVSKGEGVYPGLGWIILARKALNDVTASQQAIRLWIWPAILAASVLVGTVGWARALKRSGN